MGPREPVGVGGGEEGDLGGVEEGGGGGGDLGGVEKGSDTGVQPVGMEEVGGQVGHQLPPCGLQR